MIVIRRTSIDIAEYRAAKCPRSNFFNYTYCLSTNQMNFLIAFFDNMIVVVI